MESVIDDDSSSGTLYLHLDLAVVQDEFVHGLAVHDAEALLFSNFPHCDGVPLWMQLQPTMRGESGMKLQ